MTAPPAEQTMREGFDQERVVSCTTGADERAMILKWLRRRTGMCREELLSIPWHQFFERRRIRTMGASFNAAAILIERGIQHATDLAVESEIIAAALESSKRHRHADAPPLQNNPTRGG